MPRIYRYTCPICGQNVSTLSIAPEWDTAETRAWRRLKTVSFVHSACFERILRKNTRKKPEKCLDFWGPECQHCEHFHDPTLKACAVCEDNNGCEGCYFIATEDCPKGVASVGREQA